MNKHNLKQEFYDRLVELGVYDEWEEAWANDIIISDIGALNDVNSFSDFVSRSFFWKLAKHGYDFWYKISIS